MSVYISSPFARTTALQSLAVFVSVASHLPVSRPRVHITRAGQAGRSQSCVSIIIETSSGVGSSVRGRDPSDIREAKGNEPWNRHSRFTCFPGTPQPPSAVVQLFSSLSDLPNHLSPPHPLPSHSLAPEIRVRAVSWETGWLTRSRKDSATGVPSE